MSLKEWLHTTPTEMEVAQYHPLKQGLHGGCAQPLLKGGVSFGVAHNPPIKYCEKALPAAMENMNYAGSLKIQENACCGHASCTDLASS